jgi:RNA polymerase sigma factor (sigma-70 family)
LVELICQANDQLRRIAARIARGRNDLQATSLLHEAILKLARADWLRIQGASAGPPSEDQLIGLVVRNMRWVALDRARAGRRRRKAEDVGRAPVDEYLDNVAARCPDPLRRLEACEALERLSPRQAAVATLLDQGYTQAEAASLLGVSLSTVEEDLRKARRFLTVWEAGQERRRDAGGIEP